MKTRALELTLIVAAAVAIIKALPANPNGRYQAGADVIIDTRTGAAVWVAEPALVWPMDWRGLRSTREPVIHKRWRRVGAKPPLPIKPFLPKCPPPKPEVEDTDERE